MLMSMEVKGAQPLGLGSKRGKMEAGEKAESGRSDWINMEATGEKRLDGLWGSEVG